MRATLAVLVPNWAVAFVRSAERAVLERYDDRFIEEIPPTVKARVAPFGDVRLRLVPTGVSTATAGGARVELNLGWCRCTVPGCGRMTTRRFPTCRFPTSATSDGFLFAPLCRRNHRGWSAPSRVEEPG